MEVKDSDGRLEIELPEIVDLPAARELREHLLDVLGRDGTAALTLQADRVARLSTAAIQVMIAAGRDFAGGERPFALVRPTASIVEAFARLGLADELRKIT
ncbi:STAS domain-containing protein [Phaeospirillum tilakii]|uniref:STAS domain-containing protein n=1 Tax=Phaeospirillum tilakii TaxID=741673 RepID=A0ABW5C5A9_9PROT